MAGEKMIVEDAVGKTVKVIGKACLRLKYAGKNFNEAANLLQLGLSILEAIQKALKEPEKENPDAIV